MFRHFSVLGGRSPRVTDLGPGAAVAALRETASRTRWMWRPSANDGSGSVPFATAVTKSTFVTERVLVADRVSGRPPVRHVGMLGLGHDDPSEPLLPRRRRGVVELQLVHRLQVEGDRAAGAAQLDPQRVLATGRVARGLERADGAGGGAPSRRAVNQAASSTVTRPRCSERSPRARRSRRAAGAPRRTWSASPRRPPAATR